MCSYLYTAHRQTETHIQPPTPPHTHTHTHTGQGGGCLKSLAKAPSAECFLTSKARLAHVTGQEWFEIVVKLEQNAFLNWLCSFLSCWKSAAADGSEISRSYKIDPFKPDDNTFSSALCASSICIVFADLQSQRVFKGRRINKHFVNYLLDLNLLWQRTAFYRTKTCLNRGMIDSRPYRKWM